MHLHAPEVAGNLNVDGQVQFTKTLFGRPQVFNVGQISAAAGGAAASNVLMQVLATYDYESRSKEEASSQGTTTTRNLEGQLKP